MKLIVLFLLMIGCARFTSRTEVKSPRLVDYKETVKQDYIDHFKSFETSFLDTNRNKIHKIKKSSIRYLEEIAANIEKNNELFFTENGKAKFYIIKSEAPFHFSLPGKKIFLSDTLVERYIKNESILYCLIAYELIRSEKKAYNKFMIYPTGVLSINRILSLMRLPIREKVEVHKWAFYLLSRTGIETDSYLAWLQIKNRNSLDFVMQLGDVRSISKEESLFKTFMIKNEQGRKAQSWYKGSSRKFYSFVNNVKR